jgi:DNA-binding transcriptional LysR family regulator
VLVGRPGRTGDPLTMPWLLTGMGSGTRNTTLSLLTRLQASPPTLSLGTAGAAVAAAREGLGVTFVHEVAVLELLDSGELKTYALPGTPLERPWHLCTTSEPTAATRLFIDHVCAVDRVGTAAFHT